MNFNYISLVLRRASIIVGMTMCIFSGLAAAQSCTEFDFSGSWIVEIHVGAKASELNTSEFRWTVTSLGDCKWQVKMEMTNGNPNVVEKTLTSSIDGNGKLHLSDTENPAMVGTFDESGFSVSHTVADILWVYTGKRE